MVFSLRAANCAIQYRQLAWVVETRLGVCGGGQFFRYSRLRVHSKYRDDCSEHATISFCTTRTLTVVNSKHRYHEQLVRKLSLIHI